MPLNKQTGNMYPFVTHTWNPIRGKCPHDCSYCYMKVYPQAPLRFVEKEMTTKLGHNRFIFVGSSTDMWAEEVPKEWIDKVLKYCRNNDAYNRYLFQTKNPKRYGEYMGMFPDDVVLATTIESNRRYPAISKAPTTWMRYADILPIKLPKMVSIEPIMDFDLDTFLLWIGDIKPEFVSIGADSKRHHLPEPEPDKIRVLIKELRDITEVIIKDNLSRLYVE